MTAAETPTRRQQREATRGRIIVSAVERFAHAGYEATSLSDIARLAGVKKALVQYHFATKEALWRDAATHIWTCRNRQLASRIGSADQPRSVEGIRDAFVAVVEVTRDNPHWLWFMFHEGAANGDRMQWLIDHFIDHDYTIGQAFVREAQTRGLIREGSPLQLIHLISGSLTYNLLVAPQTLRATRQDLTSSTAIAEQVDLLMAMLSP